MNVLLKEIANIKAGHPFREAIKEDREGNGFVIQVKNINEDSQIDWDNLVKTQIAGRKEPDWLTKGDIIFISRGSRITASSIEFPLKKAVCSQHFFIINVISEQVDSEFLAWQLNQSSAQNYLQKSAEGSSQVSIRRPILEQIPLTFPDLETQKKVMVVVKCALKEKLVHLKLIENRKQQLAAITQNLLK